MRRLLSTQVTAFGISVTMPVSEMCSSRPVCLFQIHRRATFLQKLVPSPASSDRRSTPLVENIAKRDPSGDQRGSQYPSPVASPCVRFMAVPVLLEIIQMSPRYSSYRQATGVRSASAESIDRYRSTAIIVPSGEKTAPASSSNLRRSRGASPRGLVGAPSRECGSDTDAASTLVTSRLSNFNATPVSVTSIAQRRPDEWTIRACVKTGRRRALGSARASESGPAYCSTKDNHLLWRPGEVIAFCTVSSERRTALFRSMARCESSSSMLCTLGVAAMCYSSLLLQGTPRLNSAGRPGRMQVSASRRPLDVRRRFCQ
jgi:hypothetical protein